jgi:hypothetical protein
MSENSIIDEKQEEKNRGWFGFSYKMFDFLSISEEKRKELKTSAEEFSAKIIDFLKSLILIIIVVLIYFSSSGLVLFMCKLAQSNILPTEERCYPYTDTKPNIQPIKTNIFPTYGDPQMSMKMEFPYNDYNASNKILDIFRDYKKKTNSNFLANYFISIIEELMRCNYSTINTIMNTINEFLPETIIVILAPIILFFSLLIMLIINALYFIYLWFAKMSWFFKTNTSDVENEDKEPNWKNVSPIFTPITWFMGYIFSPFKWIAGFILAILFIVLFFLGGQIISFIPIISILLPLVSVMFFKSEINGKSVNLFNIILDVLKYYKLFVVGIISLFIITSAFAKLGTVPGVFSIIALIILIYFKVIEINILTPISEQNLTPLSSYSQAKKSCSNFKKKNGFLYNLLLGQNGGNITKELKTIGKNI